MSGVRSLSANQQNRRMSGGHAVAWSLRNEGVRHAFSVPGESYLALLDGMRDVPEITLITNRHEGSACLMAEAYGKTTRTPGVCMVTRGPRRHQREHRSAPRQVRLDAADPAHRPGGPGAPGPGVRPGDRLHAFLRQHRQVGHRDQRPPGRCRVLWPGRSTWRGRAARGRWWSPSPGICSRKRRTSPWWTPIPRSVRVRTRN